MKDICKNSSYDVLIYEIKRYGFSITFNKLLQKGGFDEEDEGNKRDAQGEMVKLNYDQDTNKGERAIKVGDG